MDQNNCGLVSLREVSRGVTFQTGLKCDFFFHKKTHIFSNKICKAPVDYRMHPYLCMVYTFPRPGAGILPQATEIRPLSAKY